MHPTPFDASSGDHGVTCTPGCAFDATVLVSQSQWRVMHTPEADRRVAAIAARQHGVVSRAQLLEAGLSRRAVQHRVARGRLHPLGAGVHAVGRAEVPALAMEQAALLSVGVDGVLSHTTAAARRRIITARDGPMHVTVPRDGPRSRDGVVVHRVRRLEPQDVGIVDGLPVTSAARTLLDLAGLLPPRDLRWAVEEARVRRLVSDADLQDVLDRHPRRRGAARLAGLVDAMNTGPLRTRSEAERRLIDLLAAARLPAPATNVRVCGFEVDAYWPTARLVAEVDGFAFHRTRAAFERDRRRDARLQAEGVRVLRLTWRMITDEQPATTAVIAAALAVPQP